MTKILGCFVVLRKENRGLAESVICGLKHIAETEIVVLMDADGQHDPAEISRLLQAIDAGSEFVIGSRFIPGGSTPGWPRTRRLLSRTCNVMMYPFTNVNDLSGGFLAFRRSIIDPEKMRPGSWKISFEIFSKGTWTRLVEVPITFRSRSVGLSKFSFMEAARTVTHFIRAVLLRG